MIQNLRISCKSDLTGVFTSAQLDDRNNSEAGFESKYNSIATENDVLNFNKDAIRSNSLSVNVPTKN